VQTINVGSLRRAAFGDERHLLQTWLLEYMTSSHGRAQAVAVGLAFLLIDVKHRLSWGGVLGKSPCSHSG
jgi:hypothetical protein